MAVSIEYTRDVAAVITVAVSKAEYQPAVDKALKSYRDRADIPGFRRGKAPMGMIVKKYGAGAKLEEINRLVGRALYDYIHEHKLRVLGEPMPLADLEKPINFEQDDDFEFLFEVAIAPKLDVKLDKSDKLSYYHIEASDDMVQAHIDQMLNQYGSQQEADTIEERDLVRGVLAELEGGAPKEGGLRNEQAMLLPMYIKDEASRAQFVGASKNSVVTFVPYTAYQGAVSELASFLSISKDEVPQYEGVEFSFEIQSIGRHMPAQLDEAFFVSAFGEAGEVKDEETLRAKVREGFREQFDPESDYKLLMDVRGLIVAKAGEVAYAEDILKRWLLENNKEMTDAQATEQLPRMLQDLTYQLIKDDILAEHQVEVNREEVKAFALVVAKSQFAQYGMSSVPDELLSSYAENLLKKEETYRNLSARVLDNKFAAIVKSQITLVDQFVSPEEFGKLVQPEA